MLFFRSVRLFLVAVLLLPSSVATQPSGSMKLATEDRQKAVALVERAVRAELGDPKGILFKDSTFYGGEGVSIICGYYKLPKDTDYQGYIAWGNKIIMFEHSFESEQEFRKSYKDQCREQ